MPRRPPGTPGGSWSPRAETPEPSAMQGRRNPRPATVQLLDDDGAISEQLEACLKHIFSKYCEPRPAELIPGSTSRRLSSVLLEPPRNSYLTPGGLDTWAQDTNGAPFSEETKDEMKEFLDVTDDGCLTFNGFIQLYQLQTENDEEETWRDLSSHGFDRNLRLVASRLEEESDAEMGS